MLTLYVFPGCHHGVIDAGKLGEYHESVAGSSLENE
jgi:hypothetical protein